MTPADYRTAVINGLLDLAAFLEANPALPAPYHVKVDHFAPDKPDEEMRAEVDNIAALLGTKACLPEFSYGHYRTSLSFGPIEYSVIAILAQARARHAADSSYNGCITPN
ncbi:hypothetical protein ACIBHX_50615 [Nonomuraea sp. NPDC050536]|uniref:hypothetical protein n=1 Tax=Nonomuraea sp. NPDC050536 TaxID=3364366 RepID=UPI0037CC95AC